MDLCIHPRSFALSLSHTLVGLLHKGASLIGRKDWFKQSMGKIILHVVGFCILRPLLALSLSLSLSLFTKIPQSSSTHEMSHTFVRILDFTQTLNWMRSIRRCSDT